MSQGSFTVRLYEHVEPMDRGSRYEDPLQDALDAASLGTISGGGSQLTEGGQIEFADIEVDATDIDRAVTTTVDVLEAAGAPEGSEIRSDDGVLRAFGKLQCLAIYLDGLSLPDEVYATLDFDEVTTQLGELAGPGSFRSVSQGNEEVGLFFFGPSAEEMFTRVQPLLHTLPIGQNARVVIRHGKDEFEPRTVRIPRHQSA
jgi:hypothetical protein